jgi:L-fuculose-phosphate aldolase
LKEAEARREMVAVGHRLYERNLIVATDGNISARLDDGRLIFTPTGVCKGELAEKDLVVLDSPDLWQQTAGLTSEAPMHLEVYRLRPDVSAVIHAHPPYIVALSLAGIDLDDKLLPELILTLGEVPTAPFAAPSSAEGAEAIKSLIEKHDALILYRHGALTVGSSLREALWKMERLEFAAQVTYLAQALGEPKPLTAEQVERILELRITN